MEDVPTDLVVSFSFVCVVVVDNPIVVDRKAIMREPN